MRHRRAMAFYDCLKFVNEAFFSVLVIGLSVLLASRGAITVGYGAHGLPVLYPAYRPASGAAPHSGRIFPNAWCWQTTTSGCRTCRWLSPIRMRALRRPGRRGDNSVTLKDVRFAYPEKPDQLILNDIVLAIPAGKFIGIAGPQRLRQILAHQGDRQAGGGAGRSAAGRRFRSIRSRAPFWLHAWRSCPRRPFSPRIRSTTTSATA